MKLNLITLATVKTELGISDSDSDAAITAMIPKVSSDVRRILNTNFDNYTLATASSGSTDLTLSGDSFYNYIENRPMFDMGQVVYNSNIPDDTYIVSYDPDTGVFTMSANATGDVEYVYPTLVMAQWAPVSKMIWYRIQQLNTTSATDRTHKSISYGPVSKTFADSEINTRWNYPQKYIDDLGLPFARIG